MESEELDRVILEELKKLPEDTRLAHAILRLEKKLENRNTLYIENSFRLRTILIILSLSLIAILVFMILIFVRLV